MNPRNLSNLDQLMFDVSGFDNERLEETEPDPIEYFLTLENGTKEDDQ